MDWQRRDGGNGCRFCFLSLSALLLVLLAAGIFARIRGVAEGTEIIFSSLAGIGIVINAWIDHVRRSNRS